MGTLRTDGEYGRTEWAATVGSAISTACAGNGQRVGLASDQAKRAVFASRATDILGIVVSIRRAQAQPGDVAIVSAVCLGPIQKSEPRAVSAERWSLMREGDVSEPGVRASVAAIIGKRLGGVYTSKHTLLDVADAVLAHIGTALEHAERAANAHLTVLRDVETRLAEAEQQRDEVSDALTACLLSQPMSGGKQDGRYVHLVTCSGDRREPAGKPGHSCSCAIAPKYLLTAAEQRGRALEEAIRSALTAPYDSKAVRILSAALSAPPPGA